jgi:peptidoglycan/xylan/chitin deacetylase (PgdA/CDA1 family)
MEGLSNAVLEGMASGLAVCATAVGATPEYIEDRVTGLLAIPGSPRMLADRLRELLQDPDLRSRLGSAAREKVTTTCSASTVASQYEDCYRSLIEKSARPSRRSNHNPISGTKVLMYHNVLARQLPGEPVAGHQVTVDAFRRQMVHVRNQVLRPEVVHECIVHGRKAPKGILVTFDDGADGLVRAGEILADLGLSGVAFICPGALEKGLWFYRLADALKRSRSKFLDWRGTKLTLGTTEARLAAYKSLNPILACEPADIREASLDDLMEHLQPSAEASSEGLQILDESGLRRAAATGSLYFANHTWSHANLTALSREQIHKEVQQASDWLRESGLPTLPWLAFPQGYYDQRVLNVAETAGLIPFGVEADSSNRQVFTRIGIYGMDSLLARFRLKLLLKPS